ncbi:flagellar attachment zone protein 1-like [Pyrus ussuriensis x Pyrus communis]|uniref:Flagellar attachment zone protein 1-like n=1 Tax=Pyrus ussuriensis x Pyrus communis TaxID=2448454 RepID=A0A5N5H2B7_9ROSA|nr:flagellar attachment zone protein 1-like [Pyrus ussuriensis x Pyrus communis]
MAAETVALLQIPTTDEQVEKKIEGEKASEPDGVSLTVATSSEPPAAAVEAEKAADAPAPDVPLVEEIKVENEAIPASQTLDIPKQAVDAVESLAEIKSAIKSVGREVPKEVAMDSIEIVDAPVPDVPLAEEKKMENESIPDSQTLDIQSVVASVVREAPKEPSIDSFEVGQVEEPKIVDAPLSSIVTIENQEKPLEVTSDEGSIATVKDLDVKEKLEESEHVEPEEIVQDETENDEGSIAEKTEPTRVLEEGITETTDAPSLAVEEEPEQPKIVEQEKKQDEVGPEESVDVEKVKDEGFSVDKVEDSTVVEEAKNDEDNKPSLIENLEEASLSREAQIEVQEEGDASLPDVTEKLATEDEKKEISAVDVVEKLAEEPAMETEKVREECVETKENEKSNVIPLDSTQIIKEDENKESSGVDVVEKLGDEEAVELEKVGEKKVETAADGKRDLVTEDSIQPIIEEQRKELNGGDLIEKLVDEDVVKLENFGEENVAKDVITEDNEERNVISEDPTLPIEESKKKELSGSDVAEKLAEGAVVKVESAGEEMVAKNGRIEENEKINEKVEDSTQPIDVVEKVTEEAEVETEKPAEENETKNVKFEDDENKTVLEEDVKNSIISLNEFIEKSFEGAAKDVEPVVESKAAEKIENGTPAEVETKTGMSAEEKPDEVEVEELEVKGKETVKTDADKLEKITDEVAKPDQNVEPPPTKDSDQAKPPKDLPAKSSQKQSNNLLSKVKQSLVKAKKAIIGGKSPSSRTPATGTREAIKVK